MENTEYRSEYERGVVTLTKPVFGDRVKGDLLDERNAFWYDKIEHGSAPHVSEWNDRTVDKWKASQPRIAIPLDLPSNATALAAYHELPASSHFLARGNKEGAIVAAGFPIWDLLNTDNPDSLHDDAIRMQFVTLAHDVLDTQQRMVHTKVQGIVREQLPERVLSMGSTIIPAVTKIPIHPMVGLAMIGGRALLSARSFAHSFIIDRIDDKVDLDPEVYANIKWFTKPLTERARDNELRDAAMAQLLPQTIEALEKLGISGNAVPLVDESHTSAKYLWNDSKRQERVLRYNIKKMAEVRYQLAGHRKMHLEDWDSFADEVSKFMGSVKIFGVDPREGPNPPTVTSITQKHQPKLMFVSMSVRSIVNDTVLEFTDTPRNDRIRQLIAEEDDLYPGSDMNDF